MASEGQACAPGAGTTVPGHRSPLLPLRMARCLVRHLVATPYLLPLELVVGTGFLDHIVEGAGERGQRKISTVNHANGCGVKQLANGKDDNVRAGGRQGQQLGLGRGSGREREGKYVEIQV